MGQTNADRLTPDHYIDSAPRATRAAVASIEVISAVDIRRVNKLSPRGRRDDMPSADGSSTRGGSTSVRGRVRSLHMANLQAASVPIACATGQTDRPTNGRIAVSLNAPLRRRHNNTICAPDQRQSSHTTCCYRLPFSCIHLAHISATLQLMSTQENALCRSFSGVAFRRKRGFI